MLRLFEEVTATECEMWLTMLKRCKSQQQQEKKTIYLLIACMIVKNEKH